MSTGIYARVESGAVVESPQRLPAAWRHISNPAALPDEDLAELGWLPVVDEYEALLPGQESGEPTLTVEPLRVVRTYPAVAAAVPAATARSRQAGRG